MVLMIQIGISILVGAIAGLFAGSLLGLGASLAGFNLSVLTVMYSSLPVAVLGFILAMVIARQFILDLDRPMAESMFVWWLK
jgi:hypothetical protein